MTIHLHIERIVLLDLTLDAAQLHALENQLRQQIAGDIARQWQDAELHRAVTPIVQLGAGQDGASIGAAIASAVGSATS